MLFSKIKYANEEVELVYSTRTESGSAVTTETKKEEPTPEFQKALSGLSKHLKYLTDLPEPYLATAIVTSVHISRTKDDRRLISISVKRPVRMSNSPLVFTTPNINENETTAGHKIFNDVDKLCSLAKDYVNGARAQQVMFAGGAKSKKRDALRGQVTLAEDIAAEQREAKKRIRRREMLKAFSNIVGPKPDIDPADGWDDAKLNDHITNKFEMVEYIDPDGDPDTRKRTGLFLHVPEEGEPFWGWVSTEGAVNRYWFDAPPTGFDPAALVPTAIGSQLVLWMREIWFDEKPVAEPEPAGEEADPTPQGQTIEETAEAYRKSIRPAPLPDGLNVTTEMVMQAVHSALFENPGSPEFWYELHLYGCDNATLEQHILDTLSARSNGQPTFRFNETIGIGSEESLKYHNAEFSLEPMRVVVGKGRRRQTMDGDTLVTAVRAMLNIPEAERAADDAEPEQEQQLDGDGTGEPLPEFSDDERTVIASTEGGESDVSEEEVIEEGAPV